MRIYLDNCCFNRPYDDQSQFKIRIESEAKLEIQEKVKNGLIELVWSFLLDYENSKNIDGQKQNEIYNFEKYSKIYFIGTEETEKISKKFQSIGIGKKDSIHLACAIETESDYFITTDKGILNKKNQISEISILNPVDFIIQIGETK
ncbi:MAG: PIN domain protein [Leptospiraceae bacterium]|nr:PIN domain protein [Leptospiraceae bacterium]